MINDFEPDRLKLFDDIKSTNPHLFCCYCECYLQPGDKTRDHLRPRSKGGKGKFYTAKNIRPCCFDCNQEKGNKYLNQYVGYLQSLFGEPGQDNDLLLTKITNAQKLMRLNIYR